MSEFAIHTLACYLDDNAPDMAVEHGDIPALNILDYIGKLPNKEASIVAARNDDMDTLIWLDNHNIPPHADYACYNGNTHMLHWLEKKGVHATKEGADWAEASNHTGTLRWLSCRGIIHSE